MAAISAKAFVRRNTTVRAVEGLPGIRLHQADDVVKLWRATQVATGDSDAPLPYWAFAWAGGLALASYLRDHPDSVASKRALDIGSGSGLCAVAAIRAGARSVVAVDVDRFAVAAVELNAAVNGTPVAALRRDLLDDGPPRATDVILAADCWYESGFATRVTPWLKRASQAGIDVVIGDPGRRYLPTDELIELVSYEVRTTTELEDLDQRVGHVYRFRSTQ